MVASAILLSFGIGRLLGLLVACGNSICGNSAIAAAAPLGATAEPMGTLVRVPMLGLVCLVLAPLAPRLAPPSVLASEFASGEPAPKRLDLAHIVP